MDTVSLYSASGSTSLHRGVSVYGLLLLLLNTGRSPILESFFHPVSLSHSTLCPPRSFSSALLGWLINTHIKPSNPDDGKAFVSLKFLPRWNSCKALRKDKKCEFNFCVKNVFPPKGAFAVRLSYRLTPALWSLYKKHSTRHSTFNSPQPPDVGTTSIHFLYFIF